MSKSVTACIRDAWNNSYRTEEIAYQLDEEWFLVHYYGREHDKDDYIAWHACAPHMIRGTTDVYTHVHPAASKNGCKAKAQCLECGDSVPKKLRMLIKIFNMKGAAV